ncbi:hypothetical protein [Pedobacter montanisoli]|uniref:Phage protein n=1 Tax=Pedobacter montanisoli TaxID=2923277 RepID=A0ABS9ZYE5_9SPHI|nr:hypothetical protein [Pedobacter montanisoli]MCJ0743351.1 hypothetical protein [Pedobacter montanisoli]
MNTREANKQQLIERIEKELPDFARMVKTTKDEMIVLSQDAFAADYQENEFTLLGMAVKYAGLYNREVTIIPNK